MKWEALCRQVDTVSARPVGGQEPARPERAAAPSPQEPAKVSTAPRMHRLQNPKVGGRSRRLGSSRPIWTTYRDSVWQKERTVRLARQAMVLAAKAEDTC